MPINMTIPPERLDYLLRRYAAGNCTRQELLELFQAISLAQHDEALNTSLLSIWQGISAADTLPVIDKEKIFSHVLRARPVYVLPRKRLVRMSVAAAVLLVLLLGGIVYRQSDRPSQRKIAGKNAGGKTDIAPGGNKAVLILADGSHIVLDSAHPGSLSQQGATKVIKLDSAQLVYRQAEGQREGNDADRVALQYNTIETPRGGQYQVVLADGTKVWLDAASSLKFPTRFIGDERVVELSGQAYFEVAHQKIPFKVHILNAAGDGGEVEVLGTHFNVNAYGDEAIMKTTLLEGSIRVSKANEQKLLKPGQQALIMNGNPSSLHGAAGPVIRVVPDVNTEEAVAWKNGYFQFEDAGIETVMHQLARWYDVEVSYEGPITERQFGGQMPRGVNLSEILRILEESNVHFRIDGKKVIVTP
jgi:ferric-dicitrate binding protein FerR (iron transport regulator)